MSEARLAAERREGVGKGVARKLRQAGRVPAVLYGRELDPIHLSVDAHEAELLFRSIPVDNTIVELAVEGEKKPFSTLVREIQMHPWRGTLVHIDFLRVQEGVQVEVQVPVHLVGTPIGVREGGGVLEQIVHDLPIRCVPSAIPESIEVDVSGLGLQETVHVSDLEIPADVEVLLPPDRTICSVAVPRVAVEEGAEVEGEEPAEAVGAEEPEGEAEGSEED